ncbi:hypothetical protein H5399_05240 [Tessaracoccus sp. MC1627]|uniref:hypothetical protein n=1 Tax=Tessaracoccus sp. MC1627 TaxID=2760312 RepID=UPI001603A679|nr:hypothetical protein [Tessaracoccus sp. MC1627]MBB1512009.1 hypothetical protein [Tessaracoccus sp. MC1627]
MSEIKPATITYQGPEATAVRVTEDGPMLMVDGKTVLEWGDLQRLVTVITAAGEAWTSGTAPMPTPPTPEEARELYAYRNDSYMAKRAQRAIAREFKADPDEVAF